MNSPLELCSWYPFSDEPLIKSLFYAPRFTDPCVILPENSCDGKWHLFFHSQIGIHHFISTSGLVWEPQKMIVLRGHSPSVFIENKTYYLVYEKHDYSFPFVSFSKSIVERETESRIEMRSSTDLINWSKPRFLFDSSIVPYAGHYLNSSYICRPQIIKIQNTYRLYFGASHILLFNRQKIPRYFGFVESTNLFGPYKTLNTRPLIEPNPDDKWSNLACGNIRIISYNSFFYALECGVYWNSTENKAHSAIMLLKSEDGLSFSYCKEQPIIKPSGENWASSYITSCDAQFRESEKNWYVYFSANAKPNRKMLYESIGLLLGSINVKTQNY